QPVAYSAATMPKQNVPGAVGKSDSAPPVSVRPGGRIPETTRKSSGGVPPVVAIGAPYAAPVVPFGRVAVSMVIVLGHTRTATLYSPLTAGQPGTTSAPVTVNIVPGEITMLGTTRSSTPGVPDRTPVSDIRSEERRVGEE